MQHNRSLAGPRAYPCHPRLSALVSEPAVEKKTFCCMQTEKARPGTRKQNV